MKMRIDIMPLVEKDRLFLRKGDETSEQTTYQYLEYVRTKLDSYLKALGAYCLAEGLGSNGGAHVRCTRAYFHRTNPLNVYIVSNSETSPLKAVIEVTSDENTLRALNQRFINEHHLQEEEGFIFENESKERK
jgi:hypothetical protein